MQGTKLLLIAAALLTPHLHAAPCTIEKTNYLGWPAQQLQNPWIKLIVVPQLGGRLMQVTFHGHDFLYVNDQLKGQRLPPETTQHEWINYGGDKIWPMPEGSDDEQHWSSAAGSILDNGIYQFEVLSRGKTCAIRLTSPPDPQVGQQYIRDISITPDSPVISFHAVMKNTSGFPQTWSEQSVSQYNAASPTDPTHFNPKFWGITPANPQSAFLNGFHVRTGPAGTGSQKVEDGLFKLHWGANSNEIWIDSPAGWLAVVDGTTGHTMVERTRFDKHADYPGKTTMIFYTSGQPRNRTNPAPPILYMEAEVNSPLVELAPGETFAMDTQWFPALMGADFKTTTYAGVVGAPLAATRTPTGLALSGRFGVFYPGQLIVHLYDRNGESVGASTLAQATPLEPVTLATTIPAPPETARVSIHLVDTTGLDRGPLGEARIPPQETE